MRTILLLIAIPFCLSAQVLGSFGNNMHGGSAYNAIKYQNKLYVGGLSMMNNVTVGGTYMMAPPPQHLLVEKQGLSLFTTTIYF